jgi:putative ABC transport system permease protein
VTVVSSIESSGEKNPDIRMAVGSYSGIEDHITVTAGEMYSDTIENGVIEVIIPKRTMVERNLMVGETLKVKGVESPEGVSYQLKIVGIFEATDPEDIYWYSSPSNWLQTCLMDQTKFMELFASESLERPIFTMEWVSIVDYKNYKDGA